METEYRELHKKETSMGTNLANSCHRLDIHQQNIVDTVQKLDSTMRQVRYLTSEINQMKNGSELTVSIKSGHSSKK